MYYTQQVVQHSILLICTVREVEKVNISWKISHALFAGESPFGERDDSCFQVKTSILFNNNLINGKFISLSPMSEVLSPKITWDCSSENVLQGHSFEKSWFTTLL